MLHLPDFFSAPVRRALALSLAGLAFLFFAAPLKADVPATPVMALYQFNGNLDVPYYSVTDFVSSGTSKVAGHLAQGSRVIPCLVMRDGKPVTDSNGTPFVGFETVLDARRATHADMDKLRSLMDERKALRVANHHCAADVKHVINARMLIAREQMPFFDPKGKSTKPEQGINIIDSIVREFHHSDACRKVNDRLVERRAALAKAWDDFIKANSGNWPAESLQQAKHLDYSMRTAIYEGHLDRGCNAYGACERNLIVLSIRNRADQQCLSRQGCRHAGDFQGVSSMVSQYNIWDEYLTQVSGLAACFLRSDLADQAPYTKLQGIYAQSVGDASTILFGEMAEVQALFPGVAATDVSSLRHYYHPPAMGSCFPTHDRVEFITAAAANKDGNHILLVNKRVRVDDQQPGGYLFRDFVVTPSKDGDQISIQDNFPGFVIDARKISLRKSTACTPYGVVESCNFTNVGRYRRTPPWLNAGRTVAFTCQIQDRGEQCTGAPRLQEVVVGGQCDPEMMPVSAVH